MEISVLEHLGELRGRLLKILGVVLLLTIGAFAGAEWLLEMLLKPFPMGTLSLASLKPAGVLTQTLRLSLICGLVLSLPVLLYQIWRFVSPGLQPKEQRVLLGSLSAGTLFFITGVLFAYIFAIPPALEFFWNYSETFGIIPWWTLDDYLGFVLMFLFAFGFSFEFPLVLLLLVRFGVVSPAMIAAKRSYIIVGIAVAAALLTPPDVVSQLMLGIPLWILFEISLAAAKFFRKN